MLLEVELVPQTAFFKNLRSELKKDDWDILRRRTYKACGYRCEVCGGKGYKHPVECHEMWDYDDDTHTQTLIGLEGLCPNCHSVKHFGHTQLQGGAELALKHMAKVNECSYQECIKYLEGVFAQWEERSQHEWTQNLEFLRQLDVEPPSRTVQPVKAQAMSPLSKMSARATGEPIEKEEDLLDAQDDLWF